MNSHTLPWYDGFGGVVKAEFAINDKKWTVLLCDDDTYTAYATKPDRGEVFMLTDMNSTCLDSLLTQINKGNI